MSYQCIVILGAIKYPTQPGVYLSNQCILILRAIKYPTKPARRVINRFELTTFEWWISKSMRVLLLFLISRLFNRLGFWISHSKVFRAVNFKM